MYKPDYLRRYVRVGVYFNFYIYIYIYICLKHDKKLKTYILNILNSWENDKFTR